MISSNKKSSNIKSKKQNSNSTGKNNNMAVGLYLCRRIAIRLARTIYIMAVGLHLCKATLVKVMKARQTRKLVKSQHCLS